jgi:hypothetical protein
LLVGDDSMNEKCTERSGADGLAGQGSATPCVGDRLRTRKHQRDL